MAMIEDFEDEQSWRRERIEKASKTGFFQENKATMWFRMSYLTQK